MTLTLHFLVQQLLRIPKLIERGFICEVRWCRILYLVMILDCPLLVVKTLTDLDPGTHTFTVAAFVDVFNGETTVRIIDLTPETFTWTIDQL